MANSHIVGTSSTNSLVQSNHHHLRQTSWTLTPFCKRRTRTRGFRRARRIKMSVSGRKRTMTTGWTLQKPSAVNVACMHILKRKTAKSPRPTNSRIFGRRYERDGQNWLSTRWLQKPGARLVQAPGNSFVRSWRKITLSSSLLRTDGSSKIFARIHTHPGAFAIWMPMGT